MIESHMLFKKGFYIKDLFDLTDFVRSFLEFKSQKKILE
jgi:hypothetical protein